MTSDEKRGKREFSAAQLKLIRRTVARACTDAEFDQFIAVACSCGLDPLRRQITPLILGADNAETRKLVAWATIDGLRVIAAREGDYRPMETAPLIEHEPSRIDLEKNPLGITRAEVKAWKASDGVWYPVAGEAWWDEYAPLQQEWSPDQTDAQLTARSVLAPSWSRMGRVMIAKCAEAQALRRGWPDVLSGLYGEEELHTLRLADRTASELLRQTEQRAISRQMKTRTLWFVFEPGGAFQPVKVDQVLERLLAFYETTLTREEIERFDSINRLSLQTLWEWAPSDALALKQISESRSISLPIAASAPRDSVDNSGLQEIANEVGRENPSA